MSDHQEFKDKLKKMVRIDENDLSSELAKNSSLMFKIGCYKADAEFLKDKAENIVKIVEAKVDKVVRKKYNGSKKPSEDFIKKQIARHPAVIEAIDKFIDAKHKFNICWAAASAVAQKGDQLTNLAYNKRKELEFGRNSRVDTINNKLSKLSRKGSE